MKLRVLLLSVLLLVSACSKGEQVQKETPPIEDNPVQEEVKNPEEEVKRPTPEAYAIESLLNKGKDISELSWKLEEQGPHKYALIIKEATKGKPNMTKFIFLDKDNAYVDLHMMIDKVIFDRN